MKPTKKSVLAAAIVLALAGCSTTPNSSPTSAVKAYVKDLISQNFKALNRVLYLGPKPNFSAAAYRSMDKLIASRNRSAGSLATMVAENGGLKQIKIVNVHKEKMHNFAFDKVTFVVIGKDGKLVDRRYTLALISIHTDDGWKVNPIWDS
ncbi:hypothetical protein [Acidithiobacillus caldus]|uniref:DUF4878 domain-containing protein n=1 Tax=Acidithiobacillus caldus TaxID=33059 RepID=A0A1E7YNQ6_9PROT|nr:hypothetical protein [Acidithiobacillus caldus]OFC36754.1 hypothetical protein BAE27_05325 [Acidithiobacillus caldus]OFC39905.1 hypothetical protein BAE29_06255 [Acidithiobacillus caldus]OFC40027.1 hypothetical protein BAE28_01730 [Acidithiobacillus caldus]